MMIGNIGAVDWHKFCTPLQQQNYSTTNYANIKAIEYYENGTIKRIEYFPLTSGTPNAT